jgi:hypothetical protein
MPLELGWDVLALLGLAAFASGFVDAISGGGGMITMPALLLAGLDPVSAVATNKLQGVFGTGSSMAAYARARMIDWKRLGWMMAGAAMAGMAGAFAVKSLPDHVLKALGGCIGRCADSHTEINACINQRMGCSVGRQVTQLTLCQRDVVNTGIGQYLCQRFDV